MERHGAEGFRISEMPEGCGHELSSSAEDGSGGVLLQLGHQAAADGQQGALPDVPGLHHARQEADGLRDDGH